MMTASSGACSIRVLFVGLLHYWCTACVTESELHFAAPLFLSISISLLYNMQPGVYLVVKRVISGIFLWRLCPVLVRIVHLNVLYLS